MKLSLRRSRTNDVCTIGSLYVNGTFLCNVLEDPVRELKGIPPAVWKIPGKTAIPAGQYQIVLSFSPRFRRILPELLNVPGFTGIRIHPGNTDADTEGCLLPGTWNGGDRVDASARAFSSLVAELNVAIQKNEAIWIGISNPGATEYDY